MKQNFARKRSLSVESIDIRFEFLDKKTIDSSHDIDPYEALDGSDGDDDDPMSVVVYGLHLEGGRWDGERKLLVEAKPKIHTDALPPIRLIPHHTAETADESRRKSSLSKDERGFNLYRCPTYRYSIYVPWKNARKNKQEMPAIFDIRSIRKYY